MKIHQFAGRPDEPADCEEIRHCLHVISTNASQFLSAMQEVFQADSLKMYWRNASSDLCSKQDLPTKLWQTEKPPQFCASPFSTLLKFPPEPKHLWYFIIY